MLIRIPKGWEIPEREVTPEAAYRNRREFIQTAGLAAALPLAAGVGFAQQLKKGPAHAPSAAAPLQIYPAKHNSSFGADLSLTPEWAATSYNNYYELHPTSKEAPKDMAGKFKIDPWKVEVKGLVKEPQTYDLSEILRMGNFEERVYRFRCVERWAMVVPWTGFPLSDLIKKVEPKAEAKYLRFISVNKPDEMPGIKMAPFYPWPYHEGLRMDEAMNPLALVVTGVYGKPLPKQNGAPIRIITPWKYGYKSPKSIVSIEFTASQPKTLWNDTQPSEYGFYSNVNPNKPHPRWSQATENMIPDGERKRTLLYNGYEQYVAKMYNGNEY
jgi:sulfoxide reductase catalytic subunit YedY